MKILFIIGTLSGGGAEKVAAVLSSALSKKHEMTIALDERIDNEYPISSRVKLECLSSANAGIVGKIISLRSLKKREKFDIAISFSVKTAFINVLSRIEEKVIVSVHATFSVTAGKRNAKIMKWCCKKADKVVAVSKFCEHDLINNLGVDNRKVSVIYNPVDELFLDGSNSSFFDDRQNDILKKVDNSIKLVTHGRLSPEKGHCHMIRAMRRVVEIHPSATLCILGKGPLENKLEELIKRLNLQDNVFLFGYTQSANEVLRRADIYAFSSSCEGLPIAILDALASGLPIVSSDCHGVHEVLSKDTACDLATDSIEYAKSGVLTKCFDDNWIDEDMPITFEEECFSKAVCKLIEDDDVRNKYAASSKERIKDFYVDKIIEKWEKVFA